MKYTAAEWKAYQKALKRGELLRKAKLFGIPLTVMLLGGIAQVYLADHFYGDPKCAIVRCVVVK